MRIKVQLPSVWRTDEYLADNYNPLKANKSTIALFQHEVNHADTDADSFLLIGWTLIRHPIYSPSPNNRLKGPEVRTRITSITRPKWTLNKLIWLLIYLGWASASYQFMCLMNVTSLYCFIEERVTPMSLLQRLAAVGMRWKWYYFLMFLYSLRKKILISQPSSYPLIWRALRNKTLTVSASLNLDVILQDNLRFHHFHLLGHKYFRELIRQESFKREASLLCKQGNICVHHQPCPTHQPRLLG